MGGGLGALVLLAVIVLGLILLFTGGGNGRNGRGCGRVTYDRNTGQPYYQDADGSISADPTPWQTYEDTYSGQAVFYDQNYQEHPDPGLYR